MAEHEKPGAVTSIIAIDVGAGTADIVVRDTSQPPENSVKLVVPSQTQVVAAHVRRATANQAAVLLAGPTMGGGANTRAMKAHTGAGLPFLATQSAARTFDDDLDAVRALGVQIVGDDEAQLLARRGSVSSGRGQRPLVALPSGDVDAPALLQALTALGVPTHFDAVAIAAQDHGFCPGSSNRVFRFAMWERAVRDGCALADLFSLTSARSAVAANGGADICQDTPQQVIPAPLTRLRAAAACAAALVPSVTQEDGGDVPLLAGDTGPAALLGALTDTGLAPAQSASGHGARQTPVADRPPIMERELRAREAASREAAAREEAAREVAPRKVTSRRGGDAVLLNVGNGHTIAAVAHEGRLAGVYEHHTGLLDAAKLEDHLRRFLAGKLPSEEVRQDGGHGAVLLAVPSAHTPLLVTGPNRALLTKTRLSFTYAAPWGDMMITGAVGLLEALAARLGRPLAEL